MGSKWPYFRLEDVTDKVAMGPFGSSIKVSTFVPTGIPVISGQHLHGLKVEDTEFNFVTEEHAERLKNANVTRGDVIFTHAGNIGQVAYVPFTSRYQRYVISQRQFYLRCNTARILPEFITYFFNTREGQHKLLANTSSTGVPSIARPVTYLRSIEVPVPPLGIQHRIADILGTLDDKIELNRRMNRSLEKMAAAIFKSWFIDFEPVRAKAEGRDPNLPAEIADIFPDSFEESQLGQIPKGWNMGKLGDIADHPRRGVKPGEVPPTTAYIGLEHMPRRSIALDSWGNAEQVGSQKSRFNAGEILFGKLRPYFHKVGIAPVDGVCSTDILVVVPKDESWHSYVLSLVSSKALVDYADAHSAGTKMPRTNWKDVGRYPLALPPEPLPTAFQDHVAVFHKRICMNVHQNRRLAGLRNTLLPKLLSGEIEVPTARLNEEVA